MTDTALRRIEADWKASEADDDAERLVVACRRARRDPPWDALRRCERWRRVDGFVTKWFTRPLAETDGVPPMELDAAAKARGWHEPRTLREWFQLAGKRRDLTAAHDWNGLVHEGLASASHAGITLYVGYQDEDGGAVWRVRQEHLREADPPIEWWRGEPFGRESRRLLPQPLSGFIEALVLRTYLEASDSMRSPCLGTRRPHGRIFGSADGSRRLAAYHRLPVEFHEDEARAFHGDADTLLFVLGGYLMGAARSRAAFDRLEAAFPEHNSELFG